MCDMAVAGEDVHPGAGDCCGGRGDLSELCGGFRPGEEPGRHVNVGEAVGLPVPTVLDASPGDRGGGGERSGQLGAARIPAISSSVIPTMSVSISTTAPSLSPAATRASNRSIQPGTYRRPDWARRGRAPATTAAAKQHRGRSSRPTSDRRAPLAPRSATRLRSMAKVVTSARSSPISGANPVWLLIDPCTSTRGGPSPSIQTAIAPPSLIFTSQRSVMPQTCLFRMRLASRSSSSAAVGKLQVRRATEGLRVVDLSAG